MRVINTAKGADNYLPLVRIIHWLDVAE